MDNAVLRFESPDGFNSLILDDDGKTGYAYLLDAAGKIVGDCWLYNRSAAPLQDEWTSPDNMPFANSAAYIISEAADGFGPIDTDRDLRLEWIDQGVEVLVQERLFARLIVGAKPGWSRLAAKDGPLALTLHDKANPGTRPISET
ncbi:hypothetical protein [Cognatiyoonia sp. IB215182]|uniref:hypothetical protein n=1 Tax=Cognatiyoonia sp. IB215182 TaxID=3097353 RepID=UPI002A17DE8E|nr:hypothetical protein [Cognatiyoonia sp. IB215182]MDX8354084.1 hypothetical protein [Cognatiyoonia sp. IB215182]